MAVRCLSVLQPLQPPRMRHGPGTSRDLTHKVGAVCGASSPEDAQGRLASPQDAACSEGHRTLQAGQSLSRLSRTQALSRRAGRALHLPQL